MHLTILYRIKYVSHNCEFIYYNCDFISQLRLHFWLQLYILQLRFYISQLQLYISQLKFYFSYLWHFISQIQHYISQLGLYILQVGLFISNLWLLFVIATLYLIAWHYISHIFILISHNHLFYFYTLWGKIRLQISNFMWKCSTHYLRAI